MNKTIILIISMFLIITIISMPGVEAGFVENAVDWIKDLLNIEDVRTGANSEGIYNRIKFKDIFNVKNEDEKVKDLIVKNKFKTLKNTGQPNVLAKKHEILLINNKDIDTGKFNYSLEIEIDETEIRWNGTVYQLTDKKQKLLPFERDGKIVAPNIFMGEKNARINFKDIAELGGYVLIETGKITFKIENINIKKRDSYYCDPVYYNQTDGFSALTFGSNYPTGITTNGSDFWIPDQADKWIYHVNRTGGNITDGINWSSIAGDSGVGGEAIPQDIVTNGSDLWITDYFDGFIYHVLYDGTNMSDGFDTTFSGNALTRGLSYNGSDFWVADTTDDWMYHYSADGTNLTGFSLKAYKPVVESERMTSNGSDFWIVDLTDWAYHMDADGNNISDGFSLSDSAIGFSNTRGIVLFKEGLFDYQSGSQEDFYITDIDDDFVYHISSIDLIVNNQFPINNYNYTTKYVNLTYNVSSQYGITNCSLYIGNVFNETDASITVEINQTFNKTFAEGSYSWKIVCYDINDKERNSTAWTVTVDNSAPYISVAYNITNLTVTSLPKPSKWNFTANDSKTSLESCWYNTSDNAIISIVTCNSALITTSWTTDGDKHIYYCANDTLGQQTCNTSYLTVYLYNWTQTFNKDTIGEGDITEFKLILNMTDIRSNFPDTYAILNYNNSQYPVTPIQNPHNYTFIYDLVIPQDSGSTTGQIIEWNFSFAIYNSGATPIINRSTTNQTQTVYSMEIDNCTNYSRKILNFTIKDEEQKNILDNGSIDTYIIIHSFKNSSVSWNYSNANTNVTSIKVCIPYNILNYTDYKMDVTTRYESVDYVVEYHYIDDYNLSNSDVGQNISLFDLLSSDSTSFTISYKDKYYLAKENAIIDILRFYVGDGVYRSVEMGKTNDAGQTRAHLVTEDVKYIFYVRLNGTLVYASPEYLALCQTTPCNIDLYETTDISSTYEDGGNIDYSFNLDEGARSITFIYTTKDGSSSRVNMNVTKTDAYLNTTACEEDQTSSGGTLTCTVPQYYDNTTYIIEIYEDGEFITDRYFNLNPDPKDYFGYTGVFLSFIIIITLVLMAITNGIAMVFFAILGVIIVGLLNIMDIGKLVGIGSAVIWLLVAGLILIYKMAQRRYH